MVRIYKRKNSAKAYKSNYTNQNLADAISAVQSGAMKSWKAAKEYGIPKGTLINKLKGLHPRKPGPPTAFSMEEEASIAAAVAALGDWNYPLTPFEVRQLAKSVLDQQNHVVDRFSNNLPGREWAIGFLKRHNDQIKVRIANSLSQARADLNPEEVKKFFVKRIRKSFRFLLLLILS